MGIGYVVTVDPMASDVSMDQVITDALASQQLAVIVARRPSILAAPKIRQYEKAIEVKKSACERACATACESE